ncbi:MAG TPA: CerR family C-terminal domain-containing protein [Anaeromyxobacteraceae bacterium]|nr:CerR family C-terminal domain-containing protein [Anaeromyxobacteraceae bacterium]
MPNRVRNSRLGKRDETRRRLLDSAAELFAERGFERATVREICRAASANVAAVNYHFGDKLGLYARVVEAAIGIMRESGAAAMQPRGASAEERLRTYVRVQLERVAPKAHGSWIHRLINRELESPTAALDRMVNEAIRPRIAYLSAAVAELLGCPASDPRVARVVMSIQAQCLIYTRAPILGRLMPRWRPTPAELAEHITRFSLAGMRALAGPKSGASERGGENRLARGARAGLHR